jgi:hypothetical protein
LTVCRAIWDRGTGACSLRGALAGAGPLRTRRRARAVVADLGWRRKRKRTGRRKGLERENAAIMMGLFEFGRIEA